MQRTYLWPLVILCGSILISLALVSGSKLHAGNTKPVAADVSDSFFFRLEIAGRDVGDYHECRGLGSSNDVEETVINTTADVPVRQKTAGALEWHDITLKRTKPSLADVWIWRKAMEDGDINDAIKDGAITLWRADSPIEPLARWAFRNGWVAALSFDGSIEEMTIVHEGLERTDIILPGKPPR